MPPSLSAADALRGLADLLPRLLSIESGNRPGSGFVAAHLGGQWRYLYFIHPALGGWRGPPAQRAQFFAALHAEARAQAGTPTEARLHVLLAGLEAQS